MLVVIPFVDRELSLVIKNLRLCLKWEQSVPYECLLSYESTTDPSSAAAMAAKYFSKVNHFKYDPAPVKKWPDAPNWAWQSTARHIEANYKEPWLWWEADAVPLKKGWIQAIEESHLESGKAFSGHVVEDMGHFNGVAVYPPNISHFAYKAMLCRVAAWDYVLKEETGGHVNAVNHLIAHVWNLDPQGNPLNDEGVPASFPSQKEIQRYISPSQVLFHRCKDGSLQDRLMETEWRKNRGKELAMTCS